MFPPKLSVSELVFKIKYSLENEFRSICVEGEISNLSKSANGHWYFSVIDKDSTLNCALFKMNAQRNPQIDKFKDGDLVLCVGDISVYPPRGSFQLIARQVLPAGVGDQRQKFEELKKKLGAEGLFDIDRKKKIPDYPQKIAIITSPTGAAIFDFLNIVKRRSLWMDVLIIPAIMQGGECSSSVIFAIDLALKYNALNPTAKIDLLVVARGGGSAEDLGGFNDERLARRVANCEIPTISAIGHEVDYTILDFVADVRAETPSAAAEMVTGRQMEVVRTLSNLHRRMLSGIDGKLMRQKSKLESLRPAVYKDNLSAKLNGYYKSLQRINLADRAEKLLSIDERWMAFDDLHRRLTNSMQNKLERLEQRLEKRYSVLAAINPESVLRRGYAIIRNGQQGPLITSKERFDLMAEKELEIIFSDGKVKAMKKE
ncbi:MAG: exodeoxyribonuclease VII large subunit [Bdellovibrionales bacterium RIFOXYD12_FULL_39_22]|nr:MAG: exodeoxyribonuclease VII large subunit [Bdellovibrionales bacterium RIFOXYB1_FULL_39_21]OFZ44111.1 MAG: exodeoxyribonuclease VII large subunit [Bdellovibrionales bacterium RIFOXYC12_FULL_39_17]OFZ48655.1 MAG: exodeoxyribonuclease VII large subunit [Bdellovibrionales bacterium RIFOXYC1_FULL_39_130]OFZ76769.1 MAG: exodeoxyribonuclease VII large subunit [Bdellovibrionales bacterium RIFOXYD1_FULL_39_84]OFZ95072.1 MAG: exodeoxyribonuclease VII large subunit [Bdellovibrionales bacterium RIFOX